MRSERPKFEIQAGDFSLAARGRVGAIDNLAESEALEVIALQIEISADRRGNK
jgi:hypothetical protein